MKTKARITITFQPTKTVLTLLSKAARKANGQRGVTTRIINEAVEKTLANGSKK